MSVKGPMREVGWGSCSEALFSVVQMTTLQKGGGSLMQNFGCQVIIRLNVTSII